MGNGRHRLLLSFVIVLIIALPLTASAWTQEVIEAANAVANGTANPRQQAISFQYNKQINEMAIAGKLPKDVYNANQSAFEVQNKIFTENAAAENGMKAVPQKRKPGQYSKPGTDTDIIVEKGPSGKSITAEQISRTSESYNRSVSKYLRDNGIKTGGNENWAGKTDTDFMPKPSDTTPEEFAKIAEATNKRGGTMYKDPVAAEVEANMRKPGAKVGISESANYVEEMQDLANQKIRQADTLDSQARDMRRSFPNDPARADALEAEAQLRRSQAGKYLERINDVRETVANQHGVDPAKFKPEGPASDSISAVSHERGPGTARQAADVGALGEKSLSDYTKNYARTLAEIAKQNPDLADASRQSIARSSANLSPSQKGELIEYLRRAHGDDFAGRLAKEMRSHPGRTPGAASPSGPGIKTRVAGAVGGVLGLADLYVNYQACTAEGKSEEKCFDEFKHSAKAIAAVMGTGGVAMGVLQAMGVSAATIASITAGLTAAGLPLAIYGVYRTGDRWAHAPETAANERLREQQKELLLRFGELAKGVRTEIDSLHALRSLAEGSCREAKQHVMTAVELDKDSKNLLVQLKASIPAIEKGAARCEEGRAIFNEISDLQTRARDKEEKVVKDLDWGIAAAAKCKNKGDAEKIRRAYDNCKSLTARLIADSASAKGKNERLRAIRTDAAASSSALANAEAIKGRISSNNGRINEASAAAVAAGEKVRGMNAGFVGRRAELVNRVSALAELLPDEPPLPIYREEHERALNDVALLKNGVSEIAGNIECSFGKTDPGLAVQMSLESANLYSSADAMYMSARESSAACSALADATPLAEMIDDSAKRAQSAVGMNEHLPKKADACIAGRKAGKLAVAVTGPREALIGRPASLAGQISLDGAPVKDPDAYSYRWATSDGKSVTGKKVVTLTPKSPGQKSVTLTVADADGRSATGSITITVPKPLELSVSADRKQMKPEEKVTLSAVVADDAAQCPCTYEWQSGSSSKSYTAKSVWFKYAKPGTYTISLNAKDRYGQTASASYAVTVLAPPVRDAAGGVSAKPPSKDRAAEDESLQKERDKQARLDRIKQQEKEKREQERLAEEERVRREKEKQERIRLAEEEKLRREKEKYDRERQAADDAFWEDLRRRDEANQREIARIQAEREAAERQRREKAELERQKYEKERQARLAEQERQRLAEIERQRREEAARIKKLEEERIRKENELRALREDMVRWRDRLKCLEEGKRKSPRLETDCNGSFMIGARDGHINNLRKWIANGDARLRQLGAR